MASAYGFDITPGDQGAIFALSEAGRRDRRQTFGPCEAELRKDSAYLCVRGPVSDLNEPLAEVIAAAHEVAQRLLDIVAVTVQTLVEGLLKSEFSARLPSSGFSHSGFGHLLENRAPVTGLLMSVTECPTIEQVMTATEEESDLPEGGFFPVVFRDGTARPRMSGCLSLRSNRRICRSRRSRRYGSWRSRAITLCLLRLPTRCTAR